MVIIPGYCVQGTVGNKILSGCKEVDIEHKVVKVLILSYYDSILTSYHIVVCIG